MTVDPRSSSKSLYERILAVATGYMGPAAEEYIQRRIRIVQKGEAPELVTVDKLDRLAAGIEMTAKMYLSLDKSLAFRDAILKLKNFV